MLILFPHDHNNFEPSNIRYRQAKIPQSEPVLTPDLAWESPRVNLYGSVIKTANCYEMFYQCGNAERVAYACSEDGISWHKPLTNPTDFSASAHNIIRSEGDTTSPLSSKADDCGQMTNLVAGYHMPSILFEPDSTEPYKMFAFGEAGYHVLKSTDGRQFKPYQNNPAISLLTYKNSHTNKIWCSDVAPCFKDKTGYTAMTKTYIIDEHYRTRRCIGRSTSNNFKDWGPVKTVWQPGDKEDAIALSRGYRWADFYGLCPFPYGNGYLGFLWLFEIEKELPHGTNLGKIEVFLAYSPDGIDWRYIEKEPLIPWDLNFGEYGGMVTTPGAPVFDDEGIKLYYSDSNYEHGFAERDFKKKIDSPTWVIRCAHLKKERLVGAYSDDGRLKISHIDFTEHDLRINLNASGGGCIQLIYYSAEKEIARQIIEDRDSTDILLSTPHVADVTLTIIIKKATIYAVESVKRIA